MTDIHEIESAEQAGAEYAEQAEIEAHEALVAELMQAIDRAFQKLMRVLVELALTILLNVLRVLPYLLRVGSVLVWAVSMWVVFIEVFRLYSIFSDGVVSVLCGMVAALLVLLIPVSFFAHEAEGGEVIWGGYFFAALLGFALSELARRAAVEPSFYPLASVTPPALAAVCLILVVIVNREENENEQPSA